MKRMAGGLFALALLLAGCSGAKVDPAVRAACEDFSSAWASQTAVIHDKGPAAEYDAAAVMMGAALGRGADAATGELAGWFAASRDGVSHDRAGGNLTLDEISALISSYQQVISGCAALGAKVTDSSQ